MEVIAELSYKSVVNGKSPKEFEQEQQNIVEGNAATKVQAFMRSRIARVQLKKRCDAASAIQGAFRIMQAHTLVTQRDEAAGVITHFLRGSLPAMKKRNVADRIYYSPARDREIYMAALRKMQAGTFSRDQTALFGYMFRAGLPLHPKVFDSKVFQKTFRLLDALKNAKHGSPVDVMKYVCMSNTFGEDGVFSNEQDEEISRFLKFMTINSREVDAAAVEECRAFLSSVPARLVPHIADCADSSIFQITIASIEGNYDRSDKSVNRLLRYLKRVGLQAFQRITNIGESLSSSTTMISAQELRYLGTLGVNFWEDITLRKEWMYSKKLPETFLELVKACPKNIQKDLIRAGNEINKALHRKEVLHSIMVMCREVATALVRGE